MKTLVLGAGKMMDAILTGLHQHEDLSEWYIFSPSGTSAKLLASKVGAQFISDLDEVMDVDYVFIGCKPQQLPELKTRLGPRFNTATFVSILAAISEADQQKILGVNKLIRVMPNLPVKYHQGVSLLSSNSDEASLNYFAMLFNKLGLSLVVRESELEELTLLTGSGPAFFYDFAQSLGSSFSSLNTTQRELLVRQVLLGSAVASQRSDVSLADMVSEVTSKGGVTIAVLDKFKELGLNQLIKQGIDRGKDRARELRALLQK